MPVNPNPAQASIDADIATRTKAHQTNVAAALAAPGPATPLALLALGDSWFDYPLLDNGPILEATDIIARLATMGTPSPLIHNLSHYGDATTEELALPKQQRVIDSLLTPANWVNANKKPDAILFSGGGDDIAGDQFCIFLKFADDNGGGLAVDRFQKALSAIKASYLDLFMIRDRYAPGVPIFGHCYDLPIPDGRHPACIGPWLKPSLDYYGYGDDLARATAIVSDGLTRFRTLLRGLAADPANNFFLIESQGTLTSDEWANELHPTKEGFGKIAALFLAQLKTLAPDRI